MHIVHYWDGRDGAWYIVQRQKGPMPVPGGAGRVTPAKMIQKRGGGDER